MPCTLGLLRLYLSSREPREKSQQFMRIFAASLDLSYMTIEQDIDLFAHERPGCHVVEIWSQRLGCWIPCTPTISYADAEKALQEMLSFEASLTLRIQKVKTV